MKKLVFGRISLTKMIEDQEELLQYINSDKIDFRKFNELYNRATLGLVPEYNPIINYMIIRKRLDKDVLEVILPIILRKALRRALKYRSEVERYREVPEYVIDE